jgi:hypothetical protein
LIDNKDLMKTIIEQDHKFEYSFTTLAFATLALSIQFSPAYGKVWPYLLISAWTLLLISAILSGYRVVYRLVSMKVNLNINQAEQYKIQMSNVFEAKRRN